MYYLKRDAGTRRTAKMNFKTEEFSQREEILINKCVHVKLLKEFLYRKVPLSMYASHWSSGMIPASGAGGPEFESRMGPFC